MPKCGTYLASFSMVMEPSLLTTMYLLLTASSFNSSIAGQTISCFSVIRFAPIRMTAVNAREAFHRILLR